MGLSRSGRGRRRYIWFNFNGSRLRWGSIHHTRCAADAPGRLSRAHLYGRSLDGLSSMTSCVLTMTRCSGCRHVGRCGEGDWLPPGDRIHCAVLVSNHGRVLARGRSVNMHRAHSHGGAVEPYNGSLRVSGRLVRCWMSDRSMANPLAVYFPRALKRARGCWPTRPCHAS